MKDKIIRKPSTTTLVVMMCVMGLSILMGYGVDTSVQEEMEAKLNTQIEQIDKQTKTIDYLKVSNSELEGTLTSVEANLETVENKYKETVENLELLTTDSQKTLQELETKSTTLTEQTQTIETLTKELEELKLNFEELNTDYEELKKAKAVSKRNTDSFNWDLTKVGGGSKLKRDPVPYTGKVEVGTVIEMNASAYDIDCKGCIGITKTGMDIRNNTPSIIAVDPRIIPLRSKVEIFLDGVSYGIFSAEDIGGAIKGQKIDILFPTSADKSKWGRRLVEVKVLSVGS